jgi:hypothetical protein
MATIRIRCRYCSTTTLVRPEQVLLVLSGTAGTYLFSCPACARLTDAAAGPAEALLLVAAGVPLVDGDVRRVRGEQP